MIVYVFLLDRPYMFSENVAFNRVRKVKQTGVLVNMRMQGAL